MKLTVNFLNTYTVKLDEEHWVDFDIINSPKLAKLLAYIIYQHRRKLSSIDLQKIMFDHGESNNPANALKALIYRLRTILKNNLGAYDFILSGKATYYWNPKIELDFDVDNFIYLYRLGCNEANDDEIKMDYYLRAYNLYQGVFLPMYENTEKMLMIRTYLNSQYLNISRYLVNYYLKKENYSMVEEISRRVLVNNHLDEGINTALIYSLIKQDKISLAKKHYERVSSILKDDANNSTIRKIHYYLKNDEINDKTVDIFSIQDEFNEIDTYGTYECDYDFFKKLYQLEVRKSIRTGTKRTLILLTIQSKDYIKNNLEIYNLVIEETGDLLRNVILKSLRIGDIFCRYSLKQFLILLDCQEEDALKAIERIKDTFKTFEKYERVTIEDSVSELTNVKVSINEGDFLEIM